MCITLATLLNIPTITPPSLSSCKCSKQKERKMPCSRPRSSILIILAFLGVTIFISDAEASSGSTRATRHRPSSAWLKSIGDDPRAVTGCWKRPWTCDLEGGGGDDGGGSQFPPFHRRMCCKNRCIDVMSDVYNCGLCGIHCPFTWQCCNGICIDVNINPFHCGQCWKKCSFGSLCMYGMCGYAQLPPFPFPFPPKPPKPHPPPRTLTFPQKQPKPESSPAA